MASGCQEGSLQSHPPHSSGVPQCQAWGLLPDLHPACPLGWASSPREALPSSFRQPGAQGGVGSVQSLDGVTPSRPTPLQRLDSLCVSTTNQASRTRCLRHSQMDPPNSRCGENRGWGGWGPHPLPRGGLRNTSSKPQVFGFGNHETPRPQPATHFPVAQEPYARG